jgi:hypothetical protein
MKLLPLKYLTVFIILLFSLEISKGQLNHGNKESGEITLNQCSKNGSTEKNSPNLELRENGSRPINHGEKVNTIVITCPVANCSEVRLLNLFSNQKIVLSKKNYSLISHYYLLITKTLQISLLVDILRI